MDERGPRRRVRKTVTVIGIVRAGHIIGRGHGTVYNARAGE